MIFMNPKLKIKISKINKKLQYKSKKNKLFNKNKISIHLKDYRNM